MTLYEIKEEYLTALENLEINEDGEVMNIEQLNEIKADFEEKAENVALYIKNLEVLSNGIAEEKKALDERKKSVDGKIERLKGYLGESLQALGKTEINRPKVRLSFRKSTSVNVKDVFMLPEKYINKKVTESANKTLLKKALEDGEVIEGAELVTNMYLQIK